VINLNYTNCTKKKEKNKHLTLEMYEKIQSEYNNFLFSKNKNIQKTKFMNDLAILIGTNLHFFIKNSIFYLKFRKFVKLMI